MPIAEKRALLQWLLRLADFPHCRLTASAEYRLRVGDYRVIYGFNAEQNEIYILAVGKRDKIYKNL